MGIIKDKESFYNASHCICERLKGFIDLIPDDIKSCVQEIRLRVNRNVVIVCPGYSGFLLPDGSVSPKNSPLFVTPSDISATFRSICNYSIYSHQDQIKNGYVTFRGGNRAGICGTAVIDGGEIVNIRNISSINIRVAREIKGCAGEIIEQLEGDLSGILIVGPPSSGKTTILRDIARQISSGNTGSMLRVSLVDERGEIAGVYDGTPCHDIGLCDVLDGYPKGEGIIQALRTLSPDIIICDEIGNKQDALSVEASLNAGVGIVSSMHAGSIDELKRRIQARRMLESGAFKRVVFLDNRNSPGKIREIYRVDEISDKVDRNTNAHNDGDLDRICSVSQTV